MPAESIEMVLEEHSRELMSLPGVAGTGLGVCRGGPCIKVFVIKDTPELRKKIPRALEGFPVEIVETGEIRPLDKGR